MTGAARPGERREQMSAGVPSNHDRPDMPVSYGLGDPQYGFDPLSWEWVVDRMAVARNYWVATTRPDGRPRVTPVWGVWVDGSFWFFTDRKSLKARNAKRDPRVTVHLESGDEVVVLEGDLVDTTEPGAAKPVSDAYKAKYGVTATPDEGTALYSLAHRKVLAWLESDFPSTASRWTF